MDFSRDSQEMFKMENCPDLDSRGTLTFDLSEQGGFDQKATHYVAQPCIPIDRIRICCTSCMSQYVGKHAVWRSGL